MRYISKENINEFNQDAQKLSNFFLDNHLLISTQAFADTSQSFESQLQSTLNLTEYIFNSIVNNSNYKRQICFAQDQNLLDWNAIAIDCLMVAYDTLYQMNNYEHYSIANGNNSSLRNSPLGKSLSQFDSLISPKRIYSCRDQLRKNFMGEFFSFSTPTERIRKKPFLKHELPLVYSLISSTLLAEYSGNYENELKHPGSNHQLQKRLEIYNGNRKTEHILSNYELLTCMHNNPECCFYFPGYYPIEDLVYMDSCSNDLNAYDYYINYKLESIFNIETAYMIHEQTVIHPEFYSDNPKDYPNTFMTDFSCIANCQAIFLRKYLLQDAINYLFPPQQYKKHNEQITHDKGDDCDGFALFAYISNPNNEKNSIKLHSPKSSLTPNYDFCCQRLNNVCHNVSNFLLPLCEWIFFSQLNLSNLPSWENMQSGFLSMFRKYFRFEFRQFAYNPNFNKEQTPDENSLLIWNSNFLKYTPLQGTGNPTDFINCLQALVQHAKQQSAPIGKIDWELAPRSFPTFSEDHYSHSKS